jgi:5'-methylthioadenosine phosphorylase
VRKVIGLLSSFHFRKEFLADARVQEVKTPFGAVTAYVGTMAGRATACIQRYGPNMTVPSHKINHRAHICAFKMLEVERIISQNAIGSINPMLRPGDILIPHDFIDYTKCRPQSLFDDGDCWVRVDMTEPFCPHMRQAFIAGARKVSDRVIDRGVFVCFEGPRFETPTEIRMFQQLGGDIVGTPLVPEVIFAREAEICYASISGVINYGAGLAPAVVHVGEGSMFDFYLGSGLQRHIEEATIAAISYLPVERTCPCAKALDQAFHGTEPEWFKPYRRQSRA